MLAAILLACRGEGSATTHSGEEGCRPPDVDWPDAVTTLSEVWRSDTPLPEPAELDPAWPEGLAAAEEMGLGGAVLAPGEPRTLRDELVPGWTPPSAGRRSLWMVFHETDAQIADTESPTRLATTDLPSATEAAARAQELFAIHALDALIRRANQLSAFAPVDFGLATGDDADNNQRNELRWFMAVWDGVPVRPDAGTDDTQLDAACLDPIELFEPVGADFPWYAVAGNHDVLIQGNFGNDGFADDALGEAAFGGTRDLSLPGGPLAFVTDADPERVVMDRADIAATFLEGPATPGPPGHGFTEQDVRDGSIVWSVLPVDGVPVRLIAVDANPDGLSGGELSIAERDGWLIPQLEAATAAGELIVLTSHYALGDLSMEGGGRLGDLLVAYPNVVLVLAGHTHEHRIRAFGTPDDPSAFWQIETSSTVDWPGQGRMVEVVDNGDGTLSVLTTTFDYPTPPGSLAERAAELMRIDWQTGWRTDDGVGRVEDRNTELVQRLPAGFSTTAGRAGVRSEALP
ncbi:MAG: hypothetical protein H6735_11075 [Alphaproteobacteria bacterium]|nr:hypothetical protein [Alphaproteobacteria bacterium]